MIKKHVPLPQQWLVFSFSSWLLWSPSSRLKFLSGVTTLVLCASTKPPLHNSTVDILWAMFWELRDYLSWTLLFFKITTWDTSTRAPSSWAFPFYFYELWHFQQPTQKFCIAGYYHWGLKQLKTFTIDQINCYSNKDPVPLKGVLRWCSASHESLSIDEETLVWNILPQRACQYGVIK